MNLPAFFNAFLVLGALNTSTSPTISADVVPYIQEEVEPLARRELVAYQFGKPLHLDVNRGTSYTATRYERLPLPFAQLQEGVAPPGEAITLAQVTATAQQWGDTVNVTDVANLTVFHPLFQQAIQLVSLQMPETLERNTLNTLVTANQVNFANSRANRASLLTTDVMSPHEANRIIGSLKLYGAPRFNGDEREDMMIEAGEYRDPSKSPKVMQHYVALIGTLPALDMRENAQVNTAWSFSDINRLYNAELGAYGGVRYCETNMMPYWVGNALVSGTAGTSGNLATNANYQIVVTGSPVLTSVEQQIYQASGAISVTGPTGSIQVTLPTKSGYVFSVYIGTSASPTNLGLCTAGPQVGPLAGQATQLASGSTVTITGIGVAQTPQAAPGTGITVFPTIFIANHAYGQVILENPEFFYLTGADKSDKLNQLRVVGWKCFYGTIILNQAFIARVEHSSAFVPGYNAGTMPDIS